MTVTIEADMGGPAASQWAAMADRGTSWQSWHGVAAWRLVASRTNQFSRTTNRFGGKKKSNKKTSSSLIERRTERQRLEQQRRKATSLHLIIFSILK